MPPTDLLDILRRLAVSGADPELVARGRSLLEQVDEVPVELREAVALDEPAEARVLLGLFEGDARSPEVHDAVQAEAGVVDLWSGVAAQIGVASDVLALDEAVRAEAGAVDAWSAIAARIGADSDGLPIADAVRNEAGSIDIADAVMTKVQRQSIALGPSAPPPAANSPMSWWIPALAGLAAALLFGVLYDRLPTGVDLPAAAWELHFAAADEIAIDDLSFESDAFVQVYQSEGENAPLIIWIDDSEARL